MRTPFAVDEVCSIPVGITLDELIDAMALGVAKIRLIEGYEETTTDELADLVTTWIELDMSGLRTFCKCIPLSEDGETYCIFVDSVIEKSFVIYDSISGRRAINPCPTNL